MRPNLSQLAYHIFLLGLFLPCLLTAQTPNVAPATPAKVVFQTAQGINVSGKVESLKGDTLCISDDQNNIRFFNLSLLTSYQFFDADGIPILTEKSQKLIGEPAPKPRKTEQKSVTITPKTPAKVLIQTKTGRELTGDLLWRRNDSVAVDIGIGQPIVLAITQIERIKSLNATTSNAQTDPKVLIQTKDGKALSGNLLWKRADSVAVDVGIGQPIVLSMTQIESISSVKKGGNGVFRLSEPDEQFNNYMAARSMQTLTGAPMAKGESYLRLGLPFNSNSGLGIGTEVGLRLNDYFRLYIGSPFFTLFAFNVTPSAVVPVSSSVYANIGVSTYFNFFGDSERVQFSGVSGGFLYVQPQFNVGLQVARQRNLFLPFFFFSQRTTFRTQISIPAQYRISQNWLAMGEFVASPLTENEKYSQYFLSARYLQPRFFIDMGLGHLNRTVNIPNCPTCINRNQNQWSINAGGGILIGKRQKK